LQDREVDNGGRGRRGRLRGRDGARALGRGASRRACELAVDLLREPAARGGGAGRRVVGAAVGRRLASTPYRLSRGAARGCVHFRAVAGRRLGWEAVRVGVVGDRRARGGDGRGAGAVPAAPAGCRGADPSPVHVPGGRVAVGVRLPGADGGRAGLRAVLRHGVSPGRPRREQLVRRNEPHEPDHRPTRPP